MLRVGCGRRTIINRVLGPVANFNLPLSDAGGGTANIVLAFGIGDPTFTRATAAWTKLASGNWAAVASGAPRSMYLGLDTTVGAYAGYLAEGARTNECLQARAGTATHWIATNATKAQNQTGIDGVANSGFSLTGTAGNGTVMQPIASTFTAAISRTFSCFMKRVTGTGAVALTLDGGATYTTVTPSINASTFTLVQATQSVATATVGIKLVTSGDAVAVDMAQEEQATFASTPIPTTTAAVTRNADVLTYPFAGNALAAQGWAYAELSTIWSAATGSAQLAIGFTTTSTNFPFGYGGASVPTESRANDGTNTVTKTGLTSMATGVRKRITSWGSAGLVTTGDGASVASGSFDGAMASDGIGIGCETDGGAPWFGTLKNVRIGSVQLSSSVLQSLTA